MKRIVRFMIGFVLISINLGLAVYVVALTAPGRGATDWVALTDLLAAQRWTAFGGGVLYFMVWLMFFWTWRSGRPRERFLTFDGEQGPVSISTLAIADFITRLAAEFPSIARIEPRVIPGRDMIDIFLNVRVKAGTQVNDMCHLLQQRVRQSLTDEMGIPEVNNIKVNIKGISGEHRVL